MRKDQKRLALEFIQSLYQSHEQIKEALYKNDVNRALELLEQCQYGAIRLGELIEQSEGEGTSTVDLLEKYCELVYLAYDKIKNSNGKEGKIYKKINGMLIRVENSIKNDIRQKLEVVFLPYKASMWDSLESIWKAADEDENCDAYVIPIPYYDRNSDGSLGEVHYEGEEYPDYVSVVKYDEYDFEERKPDIIFIHNPYDENNRVTTIHPFFYSKNLKQFTEKLVYVPYFILDEIDPGDEDKIKNMEHFCTVPVMYYADKVVVQSENMRKIYVDVLVREMGNTKEVKQYWEDKILGLGSPKIDKVLSIRREDYL